MQRFSKLRDQNGIDPMVRGNFLFIKKEKKNHGSKIKNKKYDIISNVKINFDFII